MVGKSVQALALVLTGLTLGSSQGCASILTTAFAPQPYSGLQTDAKILQETVHEPMPVLSVLVLVDMGASTVLDTAFLPITIPTALSHDGGGLFSTTR